MDLNTQNGESVTMTAGTPETAAATSTGSVQPNGEAGQGATGSENFIPKGVDINTLPPQIRAEVEKINQEMLRGFTAKAQKLAEEQKKYEAYDDYKQKAELYDQFSSREDFVKTWNEYVQKMNQQDQTGVVDPKTKELEQRLNTLETERKQAEMSETIEAFASAADETGNVLHPEFDRYNSMMLGEVEGPDGKPRSLSILNAAIELAPGNSPLEKLENGYKKIAELHDQIFKSGQKSGMGKMLAKVRNGTDAPTISTDKSVFTGDAKKLSAREARELAEKGVRAL